MKACGGWNASVNLYITVRFLEKANQGSRLVFSGSFPWRKLEKFRGISSFSKFLWFSSVHLLEELCRENAPSRHQDIFCRYLESTTFLNYLSEWIHSTIESGEGRRERERRGKWLRTSNNNMPSELNLYSFTSTWLLGLKVL